MAAIVNSATPACKKAPEKSPFTKAFVFFKNKMVLSLSDKSAEATIIFSTFAARYANTFPDAALVAERDRGLGEVVRAVGAERATRLGG